MFLEASSQGPLGLSNVLLSNSLFFNKSFYRWFSRKYHYHELWPTKNYTSQGGSTCTYNSSNSEWWNSNNAWHTLTECMLIWSYYVTMVTVFLPHNLPLSSPYTAGNHYTQSAKECFAMAITNTVNKLIFKPNLQLKANLKLTFNSKLT